MHRQVRQLSAALVPPLLVALSLAACERKPTSTSEGPPIAQSKGDEFAVSAVVEGPVNAGSEAALLARVEARKGFHINAEYPVNFRPDKTRQGIEFDRERYPLQESAERIPCAKGNENACELRARVPFTATSPGDHRVGGILAFSVCSEEKCLIEKAPLEVQVSVR
jgi:hypothetical protein